jgi:hypothetical protein
MPKAKTVEGRVAIHDLHATGLDQERYRGLVPEAVCRLLPGSYRCPSGASAPQA